MVEQKAVVTPWEVTGDINYEKLLTQFGLQPLHTDFSHVLFRRKKIFAHRDYQPIAQAIQQKKPFVMMTGLMPTGKFHIGHYILAQQMVLYQKLGAKIYIAVADVEAYSARSQSLEESRTIAIDQYILNYIAMGLQPENCEIYFQSERSTDSAIANQYYQLQNILASHVTFNEFKGAYGEITPGKLTASLLQGADMLQPQLLHPGLPVVVPVGVDQDPHIRLARDIAKRVGLKPFSSTYHVFLPGLKGGKMSSSDPTSFVALTDTPKEIKSKINKYAFSGGRDTVEEHRKLGGNPDIDVSYQWLTFFEEDDAKLADIYNRYKSGELLSGELKAILIEKLTAILSAHQEKRIEAKSRIHEFLYQK